MLKHTVQRQADSVIVTLEVPLDEAVSYLGSKEHRNYFEGRIQAYLAEVQKDIVEVVDLLAEEPESGVVKWFNEQLGYGFIRGIDRKDIFVHYTGISGDGFKSLKPNDPVQFRRKFSERQGEEICEAFDVVPMKR